jgi:hypothetical protein
MEDELNIDPRETDYIDDYDMDKAMNFFELKRELADLGYSEPMLIDALRQSVLNAEYAVVSAGYREMIGDQYFTGWFEFHRDQESGQYQLEQYQATLYDTTGKAADMMLDKGITKSEALKVLRFEWQREEADLTLYWPMTRTDLAAYELQIQLAALGFKDPLLSDSLREMTRSGKQLHDIYTQQDGADFTLSFEKNSNSGYQLYYTDASMDIPDKVNNQVMQYLKPDVPVATAVELLRLSLHVRNDHDPFMPLNLQETKQYIHELKLNSMNTQNLSYLQKQLLNLGFGENMNAELEKQIQSKAPEFTLNTTQEYNKQNVDYALHYKAGEKDEMYFFNKYDASLNDTKQTFYLNKGSGITAKEAYNLMEGRAVHKELENLEGQKYKAWIILDKENKTENGNFKLRPFTDGWNYKPERAIDQLDIVGIKEPGNYEKLMKSLEKGNRHQVTAMKDGKEVKLYLEANPAEHRVNLTNWKGEAQQLEHYKKPELKAANKQAAKETQTQETSKKKSKGKKMSV